MAQIDEIFWTEKSKSDIKNIYEFLCIKMEETKAFELLTKIIDKVEILYSFPEIGQKVPPPKIA